VFGRLKDPPSPQSLVGAPASGPAPAPGEAERGGPPEGLILLLFTVLTLVASGLVLTRAADHAQNDPVQKAARGEVKGVGGLSLVREANLRRALAKVAAGSRPLISNIRVAPERVDVTVRDADGSRKLLSIDPGFGVKQSDFGVGDDPAVAAAKIDAAAPERMVRAVGERTGLGPDAVDYVTMSFAGSGERNWYMALKQGPARTRQWIAARDGSDLRKPGELSRALKAANAKRTRDFAARQRKLKRTLTQRNACLGKAIDAAAFERCFKRFPL
jgi:hypothetical protein